MAEQTTHGASSGADLTTQGSEARDSGLRKGKKSRTRSKGSTGKRRKKREAMPEGFLQWTESDQKYYLDVSILLRNAKATKRQCRCMRETITQWQAIRNRWAHHPAHAAEMDAYRRAVKEFKPIEPPEPIDIDI